MNSLLWSPSPDQISDANITAFRNHINKKYNLSLDDYQALHQWSINCRPQCWQEIIDFCQLRFTKPPQAILNDHTQITDAIWFQDAELNFAENLLRYRDDHIALIERNENGVRKQLTYAELYQQVAAIAASLKDLGITKGDRVCAVMPNCIETVIAMLATTSLGAIWSSCSPDFGINGILDRFGQIKPKLLLCCDGYFYNGKTITVLDKLTQVAEGIQSIEYVIIAPYSNKRTDINCLAQQYRQPIILWNVLLEKTNAVTESTVIEFVATKPDHPLYILYSSGTTGVPKCIVHSVAGTLAQHLKELVLHTDLTRQDTIFYFTTCGWMMWNWLVSSLAVGATIVLYDGSPMYPAVDSMFTLVEEENVTIFGTSAKYIASLSKSAKAPKTTHNLAKLRTILSTGSPLSEESFDYIYRQVKQNICLSSISGGTDIVSCFALGNPTLPVYRGEIQCPGLAMDIDFFDNSGNSNIGVKGELVCKQAFPSMPIGFWQDDDGAKYAAAYFSQFDNCWSHGDYGAMTENGGIIIYGRSDAVLNPGGVRIGTAEIYRQVEKHQQVIDCIAVGQTWQNDERIILFVVLRSGLKLTTTIIEEIKALIKNHTSPRHVPAKILQVQEIPRTISGKIVELAVRNVIHGEEVKNTEALANPHSLRQFLNLTELQS